MAESLIDPQCIERPGFLWFKQRHHEPLERIDLRDVLGWLMHPIHIRLGSDDTHQGRIEHFAAVVCRHCRQPYFERYEYTSLSWRAIDELRPEEANRKLAIAHLWWRTGDLIHVNSFHEPIVSATDWPITDGDDRRAAVWKYLNDHGRDFVSCFRCGFPLQGKEKEAPCRCCVKQGRIDDEGLVVNREAFLKP